jgi:hypothetical protein
VSYVSKEESIGEGMTEGVCNSPTTKDHAYSFRGRGEGFRIHADIYIYM